MFFEQHFIAPGANKLCRWLRFYLVQAAFVSFTAHLADEVIAALGNTTITTFVSAHAVHGTKELHVHRNGHEAVVAHGTVIAVR